ncbi:MAG TPA: DsbA family protein [Candidatus Baltobacteraceae bacterium]
MTAPLQLTYYFDVLSQWCHFADKSLDRLRRDFGDRIAVELKIRLLNDGKPIAYTPEQLAAYYRRSKAIAGIETTAAWLHPGDSSLYANCAVEAVRSLGGDVESVRRKLSRAALRDGERVGTFDLACALAARLSGFDEQRLGAAMRETEPLLRKSTAEFYALPVEVVPTFVLRNAIGDTAILSGLFRYGALAAAAREMIDDADAYERYAADHPEIRDL